ncbi:hypothetical protein PLANPX_5194 [Lacipirellula parvula]|uniref:Uncharacterized protein n=1 Tax=Lacipirellula parvula TaxID=2650471 RepID=A0A5K7XHQ9_9BACT|nr:hypothetical protein PLANPX_5194 [Lacipirellula parvula]
MPFYSPSCEPLNDNGSKSRTETPATQATRLSRSNTNGIPTEVRLGERGT